MAGIADILSFAETWQRGTWSLDRLPQAIGAEIIELEGPPYILGLSLARHGKRYIFVNPWLQGSLRGMVIGHEAAHLLVGQQTPSYCSAHLATPVGESVAWFGAAALAIPRQAALETVQSDGDVDGLADRYDVPVPLANLACEYWASLEYYPQRRDGAVGDALLNLVGTLHDLTRARNHRKLLAAR